jgi:hypothetical protein
MWLRTRRVFVLEDFRSAVIVNSNRFHFSVNNDPPRTGLLRKTMFLASA